MCDGGYFLRQCMYRLQFCLESPLTCPYFSSAVTCLHMDPDPQYLAMHSTLGTVGTSLEPVFLPLKKVELRCSYGVNLL